MNRPSCWNSLPSPPNMSHFPLRMLIRTIIIGLIPTCALLSGLAASAQATVSPTSLVWNTVAVGNTSGAKVVTLTNTGSSAITINSIGITGTNAGDFLKSSTSTPCGSSLAAGANCTVNVFFRPTANGTRTATLNFTDTASNSPQQVPLSGTGTSSSSVTASPSSLSFGSVNTGSTSASQTITVTNGTSSTVTLNTATITGDFIPSSSSTPCGSSLAASAHCTASIAFKPTAAGTRTGTWSITSSASATPLTVALSGTGTSSNSGSVSASPSTLSFGSVNVGSSSSAMTATLTNGTASSISISSISITGTDAGDYSMTKTCGTSLASSASCSASVTFKPAASGTRTATLVFSNSAGTQTVVLTGTGGSTSSGGATVSPSSFSFGSLPVGTASANEIVFLRNTGTSTFSMSGMSITGADPNDFFEVTQKCGSSLAPSTSCAIYLLFDPTTTGTRNASLTINDGASNSPQTVALTGTGTPAPTTSLAISPGSTSWGSQTVGTAVNKTFTLTAGGSGSLTINGITTVGVNGVTDNTIPGTNTNGTSDFSIAANNCSASLSAGQSCSVTVSFNPSAIGNRVALLSVADSGIASPQTIELSGTGAYNTAQTAAITVDFGSRSNSQVTIPGGILGTEYLESLPSGPNRTTVVQGGFTAARYRLQFQTLFPGPLSSSPPSWSLLNSDMAKLKAAGVTTVIMEIVNTPVFLKPSPLRCAAWETSVPSSFSGWGQLAAMVVNHMDINFPNLARYYEIWNEPNTAALCSANQAADYISIYAAAAPAIKQQLQADAKANPVLNLQPIFVGGPATAGLPGAFVGSTSSTDLLTNSQTASNVDFFSYHRYFGTNLNISHGMTWDIPTSTTPSLLDLTTGSGGAQAYFLDAYRDVAASTTPLKSKTPIFYDEYNDDWQLVPDCCRNSLAYSPIFNGLVVAQLLDSVYHGATTVPSNMIYFAAAQQNMCILGIIDSAMDCSKAGAGAQAQPYPQWYIYNLIFNPSYLDLVIGGHMATSITPVTLTSDTNTGDGGLYATAFYTKTTDSVLIINTSSSSFKGVTLQINNSGLSSPTGTLYTINQANPGSMTNGVAHISSWPATTISASGGVQATFDLPPYSVLAISLK